ncbi:MAG: FKBP-type peptidyl-prolyl cis-trans isomerase [Ichthyobacteriaceae bacterium]|nr:FKBP-type peptidyl-prolyl cis-trans isomerase [Ichthyobacteriaceae bacterium]
MKHILSVAIIFLFVLFASCQNQEPRYPVAVSSGVDYEGSIELSKKINQYEERQFRKYQQIHKKTYNRSSYGFLYEIEGASGKKIESKYVVTYKYSVYNLKDVEIYSDQTKTLRIDHQDEIKGLHEGLKLMTNKSKATFLFPSHQAFGFHGDDNKVKSNTPLVYKVEVLKVESINVAK